MNAQLNVDSRVRVVSGQLLGKTNPTSIWNFAVYPSFRGGVRVSVEDLDGDGKSDLLIAPGSGYLSPTAKVPPNLLGLKGTNLSKLLNFAPSRGFIGGIYVG